MRKKMWIGFSGLFAIAVATAVVFAMAQSPKPSLTASEDCSHRFLPYDEETVRVHDGIKTTVRRSTSNSGYTTEYISENADDGSLLGMWHYTDIDGVLYTRRSVSKSNPSVYGPWSIMSVGSSIAPVLTCYVSESSTEAASLESFVASASSVEKYNSFVRNEPLRGVVKYEYWYDANGRPLRGKETSLGWPTPTPGPLTPIPSAPQPTSTPHQIKHITYSNIGEANMIEPPIATPTPTAIPIPPAPSGLTLAAAGSGGIKATWNALSNVEKYEVRYRTLSDRRTAQTTQTSYTISNLPCNSTYQVSVRAKGNSAAYGGRWGAWALEKSRRVECGQTGPRPTPTREDPGIGPIPFSE